MRINLASVLVDDQEKALRFYTEILGFLKKTDVPVGEARWLTVVSPDAPDGTELLLEPDGHPAALSSRRSSMTAFPTRRSPSTASKPSTSDCAREGSGSHRSRSRCRRSPRPYSMTPAAT
jgi:catechol 2,3-dioxygenase-like lactoylglutathione lyase family enzyme